MVHADTHVDTFTRPRDPDTSVAPTRRSGCIRGSRPSMLSPTSGGWGTRRPDVSGNVIESPELPITHEWRGPGQISCGDTQRAGVGSGLVFGRDGTGVQGRRSGGRTWWFRGRSVNAYGHTPPRMGALRQAYATPHTLSEDATRNHGRVGYQINRESPNTKMVRRSCNVAVSGPLAQSGHRVHSLTFRPALMVPR